MLKQQVIYTSKYAMKCGLTRPAMMFEAELTQPKTAIVVTPISNGRFRATAAHNGYTS
jgi:hypothetical protein